MNKRVRIPIIKKRETPALLVTRSITRTPEQYKKVSKNPRRANPGSSKAT